MDHDDYLKTLREDFAAHDKVVRKLDRIMWALILIAVSQSIIFCLKMYLLFTGEST